MAAILTGCSSHQIIGRPAPDSSSSSPTPHYTGPTELPDPDITTVPAGPTELTLKQNLELTSDDGTRATVHINSLRTAKRPSGDYGDPPAHGTFVIINVTITVTAGSLPVNPLYFSYQAPDGTTYHYGDGNTFLAGYDPQLNSNDVPAGQRVRGNIVFDGRYGHGAKLLYESPTGEIIGAWVLA
jgi:hypothetical protein